MQARVLHRRKTTWVAEAECNGPGDLATVIQSLTAMDGFPATAGLPVRVELEAPVVQSRTLTGLPPVRAKALAALVAHQPSRFFRQNGRPLITAARWERCARSTPAVARAAAVEEPWVDAIVAGCEAARLDLQAIEPVASPNGVALDLLPPLVRAELRRRERRSTRRVAVLVGALWILLGGIALVRLEQERRRIESRLEALSAPVAAVARVRGQLRDGEETVSTITRAEAERARVFTRIATITRALPDSSYLTSLTVDAGGVGSLAGVARRPSDVISSMDAPDVVAGARLVGPGSRERPLESGWEPFAIEFGRERR